jgi:hypothetical protein
MQKKKTTSKSKTANKRKIRNPALMESEEKHRMQHSSRINVGNISKISGKLNLAGGNITVHESTTGLRADEIKQLFDPLYQAIESHQKVSPADKEDLGTEAKEIQSAVIEASQNGEKIDEGLLSRRFRNIARMAPDVLDVVVKTLVHPALGIGEVARKIAERAKEETGT